MLLTVLLASLYLSIAGYGQEPPTLYTAGRTFSVNDHIVSTSVFHWYTSYGGQLSGPWRPLEGRSNWTGESLWWQSQIKQMMAANIDVLWVHLIPSMQTQRVNLFRALSQLRAQGYDVPKVAPFLDPMITWSGKPLVDVATEAGKDEFVNQYSRWFSQYYSVNTDPYADNYLEQIDGRVVLDTWHVRYNLSNLSSLTREDVESRLKTAFAQYHPVFNNGIRMVTTAFSSPTLSFADEKVPQFEVHAYYRAATQGDITSVQLKGGYWDQNIRNPGYCLPRNGGVNYDDAWNSVDRNVVKRVYIESWNEYDEGSGIYAGNPGPPYIISPNPSTDTWSNSNDPWEYIRTTAAGARAFNDTPDLDADILWHNIPTIMRAGGKATAKVVVRNQGDVSWTGALNVKLGQDERQDPVLFGPARYTIDDNTNEIPTYGGIFRGRPITFNIELTAPTSPGDYLTHWRMLLEHYIWFGEELPLTISVVSTPLNPPAAPIDAGEYTNKLTVTFSWNAVTDAVVGVAGYNCQVGTTPGGNDVFDGYVGNLLSKSIAASDGKTYYARVQTVDNVGNISQWSSSSDGITVDKSPPTAPGTPVDSGTHTTDPEITFNWGPATDSVSGIDTYSCSIGTTPGAGDVFSGDIGNVTSYTITGTTCKTYYCRVIARDRAGNSSAWSPVSDGIMVVEHGGISIGAVKILPGSVSVGLSSKDVTGVFNGHFYISESDRSAGIKVVPSAMPGGLAPGSRVDIAGTLMTNSSGERYIFGIVSLL